MHKLGYSHTDVTPANMLLTRSGHLQLCDFGTVQYVTDHSDALFETEECSSLENKALLRYYSEKNEVFSNCVDRTSCVPEENIFNKACIDRLQSIIARTTIFNYIVNLYSLSVFSASCSEIFSILITRLATLSFRDGSFPGCYKTASVTPLLKKKDLDRDNPANFRPISNLHTISKVLERLFLSRINAHVEGSTHYNQFQSAYRRGFFDGDSYPPDAE